MWEGTNAGERNEGVRVSFLTIAKSALLFGFADDMGVHHRRLKSGSTRPGSGNHLAPGSTLRGLCPFPAS